jgi:glucosylceramidase
MSMKRGRREFLGIPAANRGTSASAMQNTRIYSQERRGEAGPIRVWVTDASRKLATASGVKWSAKATGGTGTSIAVKPEIKYQELLGFGGALTGSACSVFHRLPADARGKLFRNLFHPSEMAFNVCRTTMGSSDCSETLYSYDDGEVDPDLTRFSIERDRKYILPILREARGQNPDLFLFASPWSPPGWMKSNGSLKGGCMRHTYMASYANYFLKFLRSYEAEDVAIQAVTIQNEVDGDQDGKMPACAWPQDYEADFLTMHLGPLLQRAGVRTKIWIIDHNYNLWGRALGELETPDVRKYTNAIAWHGYAGEPAWIRRVQDAFPDVEMYWTEGGPDFHSPDYARDWVKWAQTFTEVLNNCCRSLTVWTLASDQHGLPYIGESGGLGGAILIDSKTQAITYSGMFWALGHFSKFVKRGSRKIHSESSASELSHCAFENPDGSLVVVITNQGAFNACEVVLKDKGANLVLPENSVTTLVCDLDVNTAN